MLGLGCDPFYSLWGCGLRKQDCQLQLASSHEAAVHWLVAGATPAKHSNLRCEGSGLRVAVDTGLTQSLPLTRTAMYGTYS